jgi:hypothetical protein
MTAAGHNPFLDAADDMGASSGALYLKFDGNTGIYSFGKDAEELQKGTRLALNPNEFKRGWICWNNKEVMEEIMVRVVEGKPPAKGSLTDHGPYKKKQDGWREQASFEMRDIEDGTQFQFKTSSKGGNISVANLIRDFGKAFSQHPGELAIIELQHVSFEAKDEDGDSIGKKFAPVFKIVEWASEADLIAKLDAAKDSGAEAEAEEEDVQVNTKGNAASGRRRNFG